MHTILLQPMIGTPLSASLVLFALLQAAAAAAATFFSASDPAFSIVGRTRSNDDGSQAFDWEGADSTLILLNIVTFCRYQHRARDLKIEIDNASRVLQAFLFTLVWLTPRMCQVGKHPLKRFICEP